jgi:H+/Cl- antiporter ClcA
MREKKEGKTAGGRDRKTGISGLIRDRYTFRPVVFLESILVGLTAGLVVVGFRFLIGEAFFIRRRIYDELAAGPLWMLLLWIVLLSGVGLFLGWSILKYPLIRGSGIPQVKGALTRQIRFPWFPECVFKFVSGVLGLGLGLSMGREGPSVQLGAFVGKGFLKMSRYPHIERKYLITSGAAAGLAAAFSAPLAAVVFVLEELHKNFSPVLLITSMAASVAADIVSSRFFGLAPVFDFPDIRALPVDRYHFLILLGILCSFGGIAFRKGLHLFQELYVRLRIPVLARPVLPLLVSIPVCFFIFDASGGGHDLIVMLSTASITVKYLLILLLVKIPLHPASLTVPVPRGGSFSPSSCSGRS